MLRGWCESCVSRRLCWGEFVETKERKDKQERETGRGRAGRCQDIELQIRGIKWEEKKGQNKKQNNR